MTFAEAIRLGAMLAPQAKGAKFVVRPAVGQPFVLTYGNLVNVPPQAVIVETCALGAAEHAGFDLIGYGNTLAVTCPVCHTERKWLQPMVAHLNDEHEWTRERIADWVETVDKPKTTDESKEVKYATPRSWFPGAGVDYLLLGPAVQPGGGAVGDGGGQLRDQADQTDPADRLQRLGGGVRGR